MKHSGCIHFNQKFWRLKKCFWVFKRFCDVCMQANPPTSVLPHKLICCFKWLPGATENVLCSAWLKHLVYFIVMGEMRGINWQLFSSEQSLTLKPSTSRFSHLVPCERMCFYFNMLYLLFIYLFIYYLFILLLIIKNPARIIHDIRFCSLVPFSDMGCF